MEAPPEWYLHFGANASLLRNPPLRDLLSLIRKCSPFLAHCLDQEAPYLAESLKEDIDSLFENLLNDVRKASRHSNADTLMRYLRQQKRRAALLIALADLAQWWDLEKVTGALSFFAEATLQRATDHLLHKAAEEKQILLQNECQPSLGSGLIILALGKLGARELNYSSDIDLMILFDRERIRYQGRRSDQEFFVRFARELVQLLQDRTEDGYVFRTDLRLRPDPASTPLALSVNAAETYYESVGQNWERAAMIKARPVAGDLESGHAYLQRLRPFIWRKHLDFAAIEDIHSIKRQIHAVKGHREITVRGHDIKLGRGGIREIEFFAQTQQLIWGGKMPDLRVNSTCQALFALEARQIITSKARQDLESAYRFLRHVEHRIQMTEDRQTHTVPKDVAGLENLSHFSGFAQVEDFSTRLIAEMGKVEDCYAELFEEEPDLSDTGNLVFTGTEDDPETLSTIAALGFTDPPTIAASIRGWHAGRYRAMRSGRARELMTELVPALLKAFATTSDPNHAFHRFDHFLQALPAGVQLLSLLRANAHLLDSLAQCMGDAPLLAERLARWPSLIEAMIGIDRLTKDQAWLEKDLKGYLEVLPHFEDRLEALKKWAQELQFQTGLKLLKHEVHPQEAGALLSLIAETFLKFLAQEVEKEFSRSHGKPPGRGIAILALGRLGSKEMTLTSDLDLVFLYDAKPDMLSGGAKPLSSMQYYGRLAQRIIGAISATGLYQVDMRLRPSGNNGPIASALQPFIAYQQQEAWTWEHMALTRARAISGDTGFRAEIESEIATLLSQKRETEKTREDIREMRRRVTQQFSPSKEWDIKHRRGGEMDVAFLAQFLLLTQAHQHPDWLLRKPQDLFSKALPSYAHAAAFWSDLHHFKRLFAPQDEDLRHPLTQSLLARAMGIEDYAGLLIKMEETGRIIYKLFREYIGPYGEDNEFENRR